MHIRGIEINIQLRTICTGVLTRKMGPIPFVTSQSIHEDYKQKYTFFHTSKLYWYDV